MRQAKLKNPTRYWKGKKLSLEHRKKLSLSHIGKKIWNKGLKGVCKGYWIGKRRLDMCGDKHPMWKGGITPIHQQIRISKQYKEWRKKVIERDNFKCVLCGKEQHGRESLIVDHIKPFALYPELRFEISNGRSLCKKCDNKYGFKWNRHITAEENKALIDG